MSGWLGVLTERSAFFTSTACGLKAVAEAPGRGLMVPAVSIKPEETEAHFGWLSRFAGHDMPSSSTITRQKLNWKPTGAGLIVDLDGMDYTQA